MTIQKLRELRALLGRFSSDYYPYTPEWAIAEVDDLIVHASADGEAEEERSSEVS